jgi:hypothetical protein
MNLPNGNGLWPKVTLAFLVPVIAAVWALGGVRNDVARHGQEIEKKASRETVTAQYDAILQRLDAIDRRLERMGR